VGIGTAVCGFAALAAVWLPPGVQVRDKVIRSIACVIAVALALGLTTQVKFTLDVTEDRRNSFPAADQRLLASLAQPLFVTVHLAPEDPRYADLQRNVLAKLERAMPKVSIRLAAGQQGLATSAGDDRYGEVEYIYGGRSDISRSTSPREILPMLYGLAEVSPPAPAPGSDYPGYPLVAIGHVTLPWFFVGLPLCIAFAWWWSRRLPKPIAARS
jgi:ABC-2 type transport system permease protein